MCYICDALAPVCLACEVPDLGEELLGPRVHPSAGFDEADFPEIFGTVIECKNSSTQTEARFGGMFASVTTDGLMYEY